MIELWGKYNRAKVYTDSVEGEAQSQIIDLCNQEFAEESIIRIMPDTHAGAACTIGTTMTLKDKVVPNLVGVDIGCGMYCIKLADKDIDFQLIDNTIRKYIPSGMNIREEVHKRVKELRLDDLRCKNNININRAEHSIGTLGGGNHFIEINRDSKRNVYLVIHTGSRYLGKQVATHYQNIAIKECSVDIQTKDNIIKRLKESGKENLIQKELSKLKPKVINKEMAYLQGDSFNDYIHDIKIVQEYSNLNREVIANILLEKAGLTVDETFHTIHNYIDTEEMILRKGAISAKQGEKVIIPINMRDGSIIAIGKGNSDWNYSAPHGAGRLMSRRKAKEKVSLDEYIESMEGIWSTSVNYNTIDESPMAYKPIESILDNIEDTVQITDIIRPIYNYKAN